jgi:hypothetical protein
VKYHDPVVHHRHSLSLLARAAGWIATTTQGRVEVPISAILITMNAKILPVEEFGALFRSAHG